MPKKKAAAVKRPATPRILVDWESGNWPGATQSKVKYYYCKVRRESLVSIARDLSGKPTGDLKHRNYVSNMTWQNITLLNFGTSDPAEVNWYLEYFNGCGRKVTSDGQNYILDVNDDRSWLWIPAVMDLSPITVRIKIHSKRIVNLPPPHDELSQAIEDRFADIDKDRDGFLSKKEIDLALGNSKFSGVYGAMVATLKKKLGDFEEFSDDEWGIENDGITHADVTAYDRLRLKNPKNEVIVKIQNMYNNAKNKIEGASHDLFVGLIDHLSVEQGMIGDCWFLAAIVGIAHRSEKEIKNMISPLQNDRYEVKFPGISKPIIITKPTDGEIAIFSGAGSNGLWLSVLEKAYGASVNRDAYFFVETSHYDAADSGEFTSKGIKIMTGHSVDTDFLVNISGTAIELMVLSSKLAKAFRNKKIVTTGIRGGILSDYRENGLPMGHAYTVLGFDSSNNRIHIRNPWGEGGPKGVKISKGVFEMSLKDFWDNYSDISFEE